MKNELRAFKSGKYMVSDFKKMISVTGIILLGCVLTCSLFAPSNAAQTSNSTEIVTEETVVSEEIFLLKAENNRLVVYILGKTEPYIITETMVNGLPESDIFRLQKGIEIFGKENLRKALEDYCS